MKRSTSLFFAGLVVVGIVGSAHAKLAGSGGSVELTATGPAGLKIVGTTSQIAVKEDGPNVVVTVPLAGIDTGIALRNKHMREKYLEVDKFPTAELAVARSALKVGEGSGTAQGTMKIHGQTRPVTFGYTAKKGGSGYTVEGTVHESALFAVAAEGFRAVRATERLGRVGGLFSSLAPLIFALHAFRKHLGPGRRKPTSRSRLLVLFPFRFSTLQSS